MAIAVVLAVVALLGCGQQATTEDGAAVPDLAAATGEPELREVKVGALPITDLKQLFVADAKGFFRQEGLEVEIEHFEGGAAIVPAVLGGAVDVGFSNSVSMFQARARRLDLRFFAGGEYQGPGHWAGALMVPADSPIRRPEQLAGRKVAVNTVGNVLEVVLRAYLTRAGAEAGEAELLEVPFPDQPAALDAGRVDAALPVEPFVTVAKRSGARVIDAKPFAALGERPFVAGYFASADWLREHPNTASAFRRALDRATRYWNDHPEEHAAIIARYTEVPVALAEEITYGEARSRIAEKDLQPLIELSHEHGLIPRPLDASEVLAR